MFGYVCTLATFSHRIFQVHVLCYVWERLTVFQIKGGPCCMVLEIVIHSHYGSFAQDFHVIWAIVLMAVIWQKDRADLHLSVLVRQAGGYLGPKELANHKRQPFLSCESVLPSTVRYPRILVSKVENFLNVHGYHKDQTMPTCTRLDTVYPDKVSDSLFKRASYEPF